jgi:hypothetical protein
MKIFTKKSSADKYVGETEVKMDRVQFHDLSTTANTALRDIIKRYLN